MGAKSTFHYPEVVHSAFDHMVFEGHLLLFKGAWILSCQFLLISCLVLRGYLYLIYLP
jgi:hypothetical protein